MHWGGFLSAPHLPAVMIIAKMQRQHTWQRRPFSICPPAAGRNQKPSAPRHRKPTQRWLLILTFKLWNLTPKKCRKFMFLCWLCCTTNMKCVFETEGIRYRSGRKRHFGSQHEENEERGRKAFRVLHVLLNFILSTHRARLVSGSQSARVGGATGLHETKRTERGEP